MLAPDQFANEYPLPGGAVSVTVVPLVYSPPQFGAGLALTLPLAEGDTPVVSA